MEKVSKQDIDDFVTWISLKGSAPTERDLSSIWSARTKHDVPTFTIPAVKYAIDNKLIKEYYLKVKYPFAGRNRKMYRQWPKIAQMLDWMIRQGSQLGLTEYVDIPDDIDFEINDSPTVDPYTKTSIRDAVVLHSPGGGSAIYVRNVRLKSPYFETAINKERDIFTWVLVKCEGLIGVRPAKPV